MSGNSGKITFAIPVREPTAAKARLGIGEIEATALGSGGGIWLKTNNVTIIGPFHKREGRRRDIVMGLTTFRKRLFTVFCVVECLALVARGAFPDRLGSGDPGLHIIYNATNQYIIYLNEHWEVGYVHSGGYAADLSQGNYPRKRILLKSVQDVHSGEPEELYPFDEKTAFTCNGGAGWSSDGKIYNYWPRKTQVFSTDGNDILISTDVYALARSRYGLRADELFLGKIGTNVFYWKPPDTTKVFYRDASRSGAVKYFKLPKHVRDISGITSAVISEKDVAICVSRKTPGLMVISSPYEGAVFEFSFTDAKQVQGSQ
jgi:hypothetical protein